MLYLINLKEIKNMFFLKGTIYSFFFRNWNKNKKKFGANVRSKTIESRNMYMQNSVRILGIYGSRGSKPLHLS